MPAARAAARPVRAGAPGWREPRAARRPRAVDAGGPAETLALELVSARGLVGLRKVDGHDESASMALGARRLSPGAPRLGPGETRLGRSGLQVQYSASLARGAWVFSAHVPSCLLRYDKVHPLGASEVAWDWLPHGLLSATSGGSTLAGRCRRSSCRPSRADFSSLSGSALIPATEISLLTRSP